MNANDVCRSVAKLLDELKLPWEQRQRFVAACDLRCAGGPCYPECVPCWPAPRATPPEARGTGMKPGQRCTLAADHRVDYPHEHYIDVERSWETDHTRILPRCPYVEPAPPSLVEVDPVEAILAVECPRHGKDPCQGSSSYDPDPWFCASRIRAASTTTRAR